MKRETRKWLREWAETVGRHGFMASSAQDALDSDARQRAEIRKLTKALARLMEEEKPEICVTPEERRKCTAPGCVAWRLLNPKSLKNRRSHDR